MAATRERKVPALVLKMSASAAELVRRNVL